jgi:hypothetical protein
MRWLREPAADGSFGLRADHRPGDRIAAAELSAKTMALACGHFRWADSAPGHSAADTQMDQE